MKVSVIVPAHNAHDRLDDTVARLLRQTRQPDEIVLVDDGSTDATADVIAALATQHPEVVPVLLPENVGVLRAREAGVHAATGDAVWFVDDDDDADAGALAALVDALDDGADVVVGAARYVAEDGRALRTVRPPMWSGLITAGRALELLLEGRITGHLWNKLFRRDVLVAMPYTEARVHSDLGMVAAALSRSRGVARTDAVVYDYHPRGGSLIGSSRSRFDSLMAIDEAVDEALAHAAPGLRGGDAHVYFRTRFIWLSALKDALTAAQPPGRRRAIVGRARRELGIPAFAALIRRADAKRLALAASARVSLRAHVALLTRSDDGRASAPSFISAEPSRHAAARAGSTETNARVVQVFCVGRGQFENLGDAILRRPLLEWGRAGGHPHVYVGDSPAGYDAALGVAEGDAVYRSYRDWYLVALKEAWRGRAVYLFKAGETQLTLPGLREHIAVLPLLLVLRVRRGRVVRVGSGARNFAPWPRRLMRPSIILSDYIRWRDPKTAAYLGGEHAPDLAFATGADDDEIARRVEQGPRDVLVVSMRPKDDSGARPYPDREWIDGVRSFAARRRLEIWAVAQVEQDSERARRLAADLGGRVLAWDGTDHDRHEAMLRELYARTAVAVSDRLHVLITAFTEGAVPVGALTVDSDKIDRHFRAAGIEGSSIVTTGMSARELADALSRASDREAELFARLRSARVELAAVRDDVQRTIGAAGTRRSPLPPARPVVYHLGRAGQIAGGMTQVINSYLSARFPRVDVRVLTSRGDPRDPLASVTGFVHAARAIRRMPRENTVVVAHVSIGGSFLREGALLVLAARRGLATIAHIHGSTFGAFAAAHPRLVRRVLRHADLVISLSDEISAIAGGIVGSERVRLVPNAVAPGHPQAPTETVVFGGVVGRRKGVDVLLDAWAGLDHPDWSLVIAGPVAEPELAASAPSGVTFTGPLPHDELMALLDSSRIAVLPSRGEALPMFIVEAMARENCVIATSVGGIPAVLSDGAGIIVPPGDAAALRDALDRAISDASFREQTADVAHERFTQTYSTDVVFPRLEEVWLSVLSPESP